MRSLATLLLAFFLLLLQSVLLELAPFQIAPPAFGLLVVLHVAFSGRWTASGAALVAFCTGYLFDLIAGAPRGTHAFVLVLMSIFARLLAARISARGFALRAAVCFVATPVSGFLVVVVRALVTPEGGYDGVRQVPVEALLTGLFGPPVLWLLERLEGRLDPTRLRVGFARRPGGKLGGGA